MALLEILTYPDPRLRERSLEVTEVTPEIQQLLNNMLDTMYAEPGIGLAAPQVGVNYRLVVIDVGGESEENNASKVHKLINPVITERQGEISFEEGCLSVPGVRETVQRSDSVVVEALDEQGQKVTIEAHGILAVCLQHEIDHLDGVLFIDHLSRLKRQLIKSKFQKQAARAE